MSRFHNLRAQIDSALGRKAQESSGGEPDDTGESSATNPVSEPDGPEEENETMATETPLEERDDYKAGYAAALKAASERVAAVQASEHFAGREATAVKLLGKNMSAEDIADVLADLPKEQGATGTEAAAVLKAAEEGGRKEMREQMKAAGNEDLGASGDDATVTSAAKIDESWERAHASVAALKGA